MAEVKTYQGGCHCGHVRYEADADLTQVNVCNCSICTKRGFILTFIPPQQFRLQQGGEDLIDYQFHSHTIHHLFCPRCGVESFARGKHPNGSDVVAVNARCLDGIEISALNPRPFDGRSL